MHWMPKPDQPVVPNKNKMVKATVLMFLITILRYFSSFVDRHCPILTNVVEFQIVMSPMSSLYFLKHVYNLRKKRTSEDGVEKLYGPNLFKPHYFGLNKF